MAHRRHSPARRKKTGKSCFAMGALLAGRFLAAPDSYEGGDLIVADTHGTHSVKLPACDMVLYPSTMQLTGVYHNLLRRWAEL